MKKLVLDINLHDLGLRLILMSKWHINMRQTEKS